MEKESFEQLSALAHPRRLAVFRLLMRRYPDAVPAGEIAEALSLPASSLSAALAQLRGAGLITQERLGTSLRYGADIKGAGALITYLAGECCRGRPEFCASLLPEVGESDAGGGTRNVLFLCSGNSCRSIMAECLLRERAGDRFSVYSAGTMPRGEVDPRALRLLREKGHDVSGLSSKSPEFLRSVEAPRIDLAFTLCDHAANEDCPTWPGQPVTSHWGLPDPAAAEGSEEEISAAYQAVYDELASRIDQLASLPLESLGRSALQARVDDIALEARSA